MTGVRKWFQARQYAYTTNVLADEVSYQAYFADHPGDAESASCLIGASTNKDILILKAVLSPAFAKDQKELFESWVKVANEHSEGGCFGFNDERQVWFRISLFRPEGVVNATEMDHLVSEVMHAIHQRHEFLMELDRLQSATPADDNPSPSDDQPHGIRVMKHVLARQSSAPANLLPPVNYIHLNNCPR